MSEEPKKLLTEEATFEVDVPNKYGTIEKFVASKDYLMMVSQMDSKVRENFFNCYMSCEKFEITDQSCIGGRCFIVITFWYEDWIDQINVTDASVMIGEKKQGE